MTLATPPWLLAQFFKSLYLQYISWIVCRVYYVTTAGLNDLDATSSHSYVYSFVLIKQPFDYLSRLL